MSAEDMEGDVGEQQEVEVEELGEDAAPTTREHAGGHIGGSHANGRKSQDPASQPPLGRTDSKPKGAPHRKKVRPPGEGGSCGGLTQLPLQRVKNMMRANDRVAAITTEAAVLTTKATEVFIEWITKEGFRSKDDGIPKRGLTYGDLPPMLDKYPAQLEFCKDILSFKKPKWEHLGQSEPTNVAAKRAASKLRAAPAGGGVKKWWTPKSQQTPRPQQAGSASPGGSPADEVNSASPSYSNAGSGAPGALEMSDTTMANLNGAHPGGAAAVQLPQILQQFPMLITPALLGALGGAGGGNLTQMQVHEIQQAIQLMHQQSAFQHALQQAITNASQQTAAAAQQGGSGAAPAEPRSE